jgi:signal transduction histidine kinase/CheY-like chemotaxis protein
MTAVPLSHNGFGGAVVSYLDITQRKQAEALLSDTNRALEARVAERTAALREEIERREEAQAALLRSQKLQAVGELAGGMAHDFNNLLTVITGYLELLGLRQMDERAAELVRRAEDAARMGARLASRLLVIGRRHRLQPVTLNLNDVARSMTDVLRRTLGDQIEVKTSLADGLWPAQADLSEVENALLNLAINARDAMPDGGVLEVNTRNQSLGPDDVAGEAGLAPGDYVMLSVSDTGVGIAPDILPRVFEPYFSTKDAGRGTGLGLSTIYGFARQSGGHASIYSEIGKGTRVSLFLPRASEDAPAADARKPAAPAPASGERILVVEDNPDVREITIKRLDLLGYTVLTAETGVAAIEMLRSMPGIQLVFSDVVMPGGVSGFDLAAWIRANRPGVRILLTSGFTGEVARHGEEPEMAHVPLLSKPYALPELARAVREALS